MQTCPAALGYSFAAGTSDGPGAFDFTQNDPGAPSNPLWSVVSGLLRVPTAQQVSYPQSYRYWNYRRLMMMCF